MWDEDGNQAANKSSFQEDRLNDKLRWALIYMDILTTFLCSYEISRKRSVVWQAHHPLNQESSFGAMFGWNFKEFSFRAPSICSCRGSMSRFSQGVYIASLLANTKTPRLMNDVLSRSCGAKTSWQHLVKERRDLVAQSLVYRLAQDKRCLSICSIRRIEPILLLPCIYRRERNSAEEV